MALHNTNPTTTAVWKRLQNHFQDIKNVSMQKMFQEDALRTNKMSIEWKDFFVDFSKNRISDETLNLLMALANEMKLKEAISKYFSGDNINQTENRAVLHTALRASKNAVLNVEGKNVISEINQVKNKIEKFTNDVISGNKKGHTNQSFTDVVNIGIGGSDLGPAMVVEALQYYKNHLNVHFISNIDGDHVQELLEKINPETTLFIVVSKTFTTQETLTNAETIKNWFLQKANPEHVAKHFVAVSTNIDKVTDFGINPENIFPMWDWVGGRFSLWSAVGLSISLAVGYDKFSELFDGAHEMDEHFKTEDFNQNIPVILALLSIWYNNFFSAETEAIIPYSQYLHKLTPYLQQAMMESNGKQVDRNGEKVNYQTGTIIWGEPGSNSQHAFFQLIHQGTKLIPADFIGFIESLHGNQLHHDILMANFFAQTEALLNGKSKELVSEEFTKMNISEAQKSFLTPFKTFEGNKPTNTILIKKLTPKSLGALIAMYEHKIFVQGVIWNIFSYDQWGVELGKQLATSIIDEISSKEIKTHDSSTKTLLNYYLKYRK